MVSSSILMKLLSRCSYSFVSFSSSPSSRPQSFSRGDIIEVKGLAVAVPEGVVVELKQPQGGFVFQRHGSRTLLEEVEALKVRDPPSPTLNAIPLP